jgi:hypothetical protein
MMKLLVKSGECSMAEAGKLIPTQPDAKLEC